MNRFLKIIDHNGLLVLINKNEISHIYENFPTLKFKTTIQLKNIDTWFYSDQTLSEIEQYNKKD